MLKKRYFSILTIIFTAGVGLAINLFKHDNSCFRIIIIAILAVSAAFGIFLACKFDIRRNESKTATALMALAVLCLGFIRVWIYADNVSYNSLYDGCSDNVLFEVVKPRENSADVKILKSSAGLPENTRVKFYTDEELITGERFTAQINYNYKFRNDLLSDGISLTAYGYVTSRDGGDLLFGVRQYANRTCDELFSSFDNSSSLAKAVITGDRSNMDGRIYTIFSNAGISHLLAISGLHISVLAVSLFSVLNRFGVHKNICSLLGAVSALLYAAMVGYSPSVIRAAVMISVSLTVTAFFGDFDRVELLFVILAAFVLINPFSLCSVSLLLTFSCTFGVMAVNGIINYKAVGSLRRRDRSNPLKVFKHKLKKHFLAPATVAFSAAVFSFPVLFFFSDTFSYITPLTNIVFVPAFSFAVQLALYSVGAFLIFPPVGKLLAYVSGFIFEAVTYCCDILFSANIGRASSSMPLIFIAFILALLLIIIIIRQNKRFESRAIFVAVAFILSIILSITANIVSAYDTAIIQIGADVNKYVYIQTESSSCYFDVGGTASADCVFENGNICLDKYIVFSATKSAVNRFKAMSSCVNIKTVYLPETDIIDELDNISAIKELANKRNCDIIFYYKSEAFTLCDEQKVSFWIDGGTPIVEYIDKYHRISAVCGNYSGFVYSDVVVLMKNFTGVPQDLCCNRLAVRSGFEGNEIYHDMVYEELFRVKFKISEQKGYEYDY